MTISMPVTIRRQKRHRRPITAHFALSAKVSHLQDRAKLIRHPAVVTRTAGKEHVGQKIAFPVGLDPEVAQQLVKILFHKMQSAVAAW